MSDNQYLEIIENKLDDITKMMEQQSKSGVFFDGFTKQVLEKIHNQLEYISNFETNELISYLTEEMRRTLEERQNAIQQRLDNVQDSISSVRSNLTDSLKSPEMHQAFTKISDSILDFSRDLNAQTKYFNSTVENIQNDIGKIRLDDKFEEQASIIRTEINNYKTSLNSLSSDINSSFDVIRKLIENSAPSETLVAMAGDISVVQKGLNDVINAVVTMNGKQEDLIEDFSKLAMNFDSSNVREEVSSLLAEIQALKESLRILVNKSDIEALNEKLNFAIETVSNLKEIAAFNDDENKSIFKTYFNDLNNLLASLVSKEEGEFIKNKIEFFQAALESGKQDIREIIQSSNNEVRNIVPLISSLSTKENLRELSESTINSLTELTEQWTEQITKNSNLANERMEVVKHAISNIYETLSNISSKVDAVSAGNGGYAVQEELDAILSHVNDMSEQVASSTKNSVSELAKNFTDISNLIASRTSGLEQIIFASQDNLKSSLAENIEQLKEFTQNLTTAVSDFNNTINSQFGSLEALSSNVSEIKSDLSDNRRFAQESKDEIKSVVLERYDDLSKKVNDLSALYLTSSLENKSELLNSIELLKNIVSSSKNSLNDTEVFNSINGKIDEVGVYLRDEKDVLVQSLDAINGQAGRIEDLNNRIGELFNTLNENQKSAQENKDEIKSVVSERYEDLGRRINDLSVLYVNSSVENKNELLNSIELLKEVVSSSRNSLDDNETFASINERINEISNYLKEEKDILVQSLDTISGKAGRIEELNNSVNNLFNSLNESQRITQESKDELKSIFYERYENLERRINDLSGLYENSSLENKNELLGSIDLLKNIVENTRNTVDNSEIMQAVEEKISGLENILRDNEYSHAQNASQLADTVNNQSNILEDIQNSIRDLFNLTERLADREDNQTALTEINNSVKGLYDVAGQIAQNSDYSGVLNEIKSEIISLPEKTEQKAEENKNEIKSVVYERYEELNKKVNDLSALFLTSSLENKSEILNNFETLRSIIEATKTYVADEQRYNLIDEKLNSLADILRQNQENLSSAHEQTVETVNQGRELINTLSNSINDLFTSISDGRKEVLSNKEDIVNELAQKVYSVTLLIEETKTLVNENFEGNRNKLQNEFSELHDRTETIKNLLAEINQNQATKEILGAILENVTAKLAEVSEIINADKDVTLEHSERVRQLTDDLKSELANITAHLNQSEEFAQNLMSRVSTGFAETADNLQKQTTLLKNVILNVSTGQTAETVQKIEALSETIKAVQSSIESFNFDESVKEQLIALKQQMEMFNQQSLGDIFGRINENDEQTNQKINDVIAELKQNFADTMSRFDMVQAQADNLQNAINSTVAQNIEEVNRKFEIFADSIKGNSYENKEQLLSAINDLKNSTGELYNGINAVNDKVPQREFIVEQADRINSVINDFAQNVNSKLEEINDTDQGYVKTAVKEAFVELQQQIGESINYLKGLNLNLDRSLESTKNAILESVDVIKESSNRSIDTVNDAKGEIITQLSGAVSENVANMKAGFEFKLQDTFEKFNEKIAFMTGGMQTQTEHNKAQILENLEGVKAFANDAKTEMTGILENTRNDLQMLVGDGFKTNLVELEDRLNILAKTVTESASANKDELVSAVNILKADLSELISSNAEKLKQSDDTFKAEISEKLQSVLQDCIQKIADISNELKSNSADNKNEILAKFDEIKNILNADSTISSINSLKEDLQNANTNITAINEKITENKTSISEIKENIQQELQNANAEITTLTEKVENNIQKTEAFGGEVKELLNNSLNQIGEKLSENKNDIADFRENLQLELKNSINEITEKLFKADEDNSSLRESLLFELQKTYNGLNEKLESNSEKTGEILRGIADNIDFGELKAAICQETISNRDVLNGKLDELMTEIANNKSGFEALSAQNKDAILAQITNLKNDIDAINPTSNPDAIVNEIREVGQKLESVSDDILDALSNDLDASFTDNFKAITDSIEDKISFIKDDIQEIVLKISEIDTIIDKVKDVVVMQFEDYFGSFDTRIGTLSEDIKKYFDTNTEKITEAIAQYQQELNSLSGIDLTSYNAETRQFVQEQIEQLKQKLDELKSSDTVEKEIVKIKSAMGALNIQSQKLNQNITDIVKDGNSSLLSVLERYQENVKALSNIDLSELKTQNNQFVKEELKQLKEQIIRNLASVFENISFIEEAEEIQNAIYDNTDYLKEEIDKLKQELIANSNSNADTDAKFNNLKNILESITTGETQDSDKYIYTLPDVETDIARMRMAINDITDMLKQNQDDEDFVAARLGSIDDIRDDISSISKRTNKLILTSDESNKNLRETLEEFKKVIKNVDDHTNGMNTAEIKKNLVDTKALVLSGLKSNQVLNEAFMHLAEWIDSSTTTTNSIASQVDDNKDNIKDIKSDLIRLEDRTQEVKDVVDGLMLKFDKKLDVDYSKFLYDIECGLDKLNDKLDVQELKIKSLEKKLDNMANAPGAGDDVTSLLEFIATQVTAANENSRSNKLLLQRVESMEKQMNQFEKDISKITAFIDGVN